MLSRLLRLAAGVFCALLLAGCVSRIVDPAPKKFFYDVRAVVVVAGPKVPLALVQGVERRMSDAVAATVRSEVLPRVILTVRLEQVGISIGLDNNKNEAEVKVSAASVETGELVAEGDFKVLTETGNASLAAESLAEEVSARLRSLFYLQRPPVQ
ncbi:hypothetical protein E6C51_04710 [Allorhizobium terrae]|uniref:Uncharacterized protein n=1 Tax=Allorhizobium terrae TaxID=1848972 RepID=A0A4S4A1P0_9HYPH|nr:hypothetical protein E6C51_04710 [Allorhizobium terrae]